MSLESLYQEIILDHYRNPLGRVELPDYDAEVHHVNPVCGDELTVRIKLSGDQIVGLSHTGQGCSISQASASVMWDLTHQLSVSDSLKLADEFLEIMQSQGKATPDEDRLGDAVAFVGVSQFPARVKCALLGWMALRDAIEQAKEKS